MAVLDATNRTRVRNHFMRLGSTVLGSVSITKPELQAFMDATDQWIDDNAASFNSALPLPARTSLTAQQKTVGFCLVAMRRAGLLTTQDD